MKEADRKKKNWWKEAIKNIPFAVFTLFILGLAVFYEEVGWASFFHIILKASLIIGGIFVLALTYVGVWAEKEEVEKTYKERLNVIEHAKEELKEFSN